MKKLLSLTLFLIVLISVTACAPTQTSSSQNKTPPSPIESEAPKIEGEGKLGDYYVKIVSAKKSTDYEGKDVLVVTYEWTNNGKEATSFMVAFIAKAYQNGVECSSAFLVDDVDAEKSMNNIKPGTTYTVQEAYLLQDESEVTIEVTELFSFSNDMVSKTFVLK